MNSMKLLLHACCGPCSLMPAGLLQDAGHDITIAYMNSNIHPETEYEKRRATLRTWARLMGTVVIEGSYDPVLWQKIVGDITAIDGYKREDRCRACYRMRLEEAAAYAEEQGYEGLSTTLTVSPYQFIDIIGEELEGVCEKYGLEPVFEDFRPYYREATRKSRDLGMYQQNYCGCHYSECEAAEEREERKRAREAEKAAKRRIRENR